MMGIDLSQLFDDVQQNGMPAEIATTTFLGFAVQRMDFFKVKECWTVLLTAETAEFFHWLTEGRFFVIPRHQATHYIHVSGRRQTKNIMMVKQPSGYLYFFKVTAGNAEILQEWMAASAGKGNSAAPIGNIYRRISRFVPRLP